MTRPNDELGGLYGAYVATHDSTPSWNLARPPKMSGWCWTGL